LNLRLITFMMLILVGPDSFPPTQPMIGSSLSSSASSQSSVVPQCRQKLNRSETTINIIDEELNDDDDDDDDDDDEDLVTMEGFENEVSEDPIVENYEKAQSDLVDELEEEEYEVESILGKRIKNKVIIC
jgi:hypothetical protein